MQQRTRRLAILFGGTVLASLGVLLAACSTDNGNTPPPGSGTDSGRDSAKADGSDETPDGEDGSPGLKDAGAADCSTAPKLRSNDTGGFYCSFYARDAAAGDAGGRSNCADDETCCNPGKKADGTFPSSFCAKTPVDEKGGDNGQAACAAQAAANGSTWVAEKSSTWECGDKNNCDDGQVCCLFTWADAGTDKVNIGNSLDKDIPKSCNALQAFKQGGTRCATSCAAGVEIQLCSKSDDTCTGNQKCTPFSALSRDLAACRQ
jgi:hypothetical protein